MVANIWPMKPSGVQLTRPIRPPGRTTRTSSSALAWWCGANMMPTHESADVELAVVERQRLGVGLLPGELDVRRLGVPAARLEQLGGQVGGDDGAAGQRGRDRGVAGAGGDVEDPLARLDPAGVGDGLAEVGDEVDGDVVVVAERPHRAVLGLDLGVGRGRGLLSHGGAPSLASVEVTDHSVGHVAGRPSSDRSVATAVHDLYWSPRPGGPTLDRGSRPGGSHMSTYGQFCPVAKAMEVLDERWTLLVVRELLYGSTHFNELRRGVPKMSPALLSKRLRSPGARRGRRAPRGRRPGQLPPDAERPGAARHRDGARRVGRALDRRARRAGPRPAPAAVGHAAQGARSTPGPAQRTVLALRFGDVEAKAAAVVAGRRRRGGRRLRLRPRLRGHRHRAARSCATLVRVWRGDDSPGTRCCRRGAVEVDGPSSVRRSLPAWLGQSESALWPRPQVEAALV